MAIYCVFCRNLHVFFGVNFILQKFCLCKKNDKYEVCSYLAQKKLISEMISVIIENNAKYYFAQFEADW